MLINFINQATCYKQPFKSAFSKLYSKYQKLSKNQKISLIAATAISSSLAAYAIISSKKGKAPLAVHENSKKPKKTSSIKSGNAWEWGSKLSVTTFSRLGLPLSHFINPQAKFAYLKTQISNPTTPLPLKKDLIARIYPEPFSEFIKIAIDIVKDLCIHPDVKKEILSKLGYYSGSDKQPLEILKQLQALIKEPQLHSDHQVDIDLKKEIAITMTLIVKKHTELFPVFVAMSIELLKDQLIHQDIKKEILSKLGYYSGSDKQPTETLKQLQAIIRSPQLHDELQIDIELKKQIACTMIMIVGRHLELFPVFVTMSIELLKDQLIHQDIKKEILIQLWLHTDSDKQPAETLKQLQTLIKDLLLHDDPQVDIELKKQIAHTISWIAKKHLELFPVFVTMSIELLKDQLIHQDIKKEILIVLPFYSGSDKQPLEILKQLQTLIKEPQVDIELKKQIAHTISWTAKRHLELFPVFVAMSIKLLKDQLIHQDIKKEILIVLRSHSESDKLPLKTLKQLKAIIRGPQLHDDLQIDIELKKQIACTMIMIVGQHLELFPVFVAMSIKLLKDQLIHQDIKKEILIVLRSHSESDKQPIETLKQLKAIIRGPQLHDDLQIDIELKKQIACTMIMIVGRHLELFPVFVVMSIELLKDQLIHQDVKEKILLGSRLYWYFHENELWSYTESDKQQPLKTLKQMALIEHITD